MKSKGFTNNNKKREEAYSLGYKEGQEKKLKQQQQEN